MPDVKRVTEQKILNALRGHTNTHIPFWLMRQAGRYLPEYRELRAHKGGFLDMLYDPESAAEVTLQPIRRFGMDGAILFSDILVIPQALGQNLTFEKGEGPRLSPIRDQADIDRLKSVNDIDQTLSPIYQTLRNVGEKLEGEKFSHVTPLGFAGSPWTVACYMIEGGGSRDFETARAMVLKRGSFFERLLEKLIPATAHYLSRQIEAGVQAIQLFDSWSGVLDEGLFDTCVIQPTQALVRLIKSKHPDIPIIGFPRGAGLYAANYATKTGIQALSIDYTYPAERARDDIQSQGICIQGNLDPARLLAGGDALKNEALRILDVLSSGPFIFNLGHGVIKETPPEHVAELTRIIRNYTP
ncbi:MAG: uroporphyrinogen decarboxylase [Alphaproteobacteria bacterium]|nr:uroporphyrinogen decarboxylase [Alphaproteobacteria bacterium]